MKSSAAQFYPAPLLGRHWRKAIVVALAFFVSSVAGAAADDSNNGRRVDEDAALRASQAAVGGAVGNYVFTTTLNRKVQLADYRGKPLVVSLIYTSCADICPVVSETLADVVDVAQEALGKDSFRVVTVGFDARKDTPRQMRAFARSRGLNVEGWEFLSADADTVDRLATDLGFMFFPGPQGFDHMSQTTVLDQEGRVYRQIYGASFATPQLVEPLKQLVFGRRGNLESWSGLVNKVRLFCTIYNPSSGRYQFDYSVIVSIVVGGLILTMIGAFLVRAWLRSRRLGMS